MIWLGQLHTSRGRRLRGWSRSRLRSSGGSGGGLALSRSLGLCLLFLLAAEDGLKALLDLGKRVRG